MKLEEKIRLLAQQSSELQAYFGNPANGTFRWFDRQLMPGYIDKGSCVRVRRVSTPRLYSKETNNQRSQNRMAQPRVQIDVLDLSAVTARSAATAISDWLATADFSSDAQFASPATSPKRHPNFVINQMAGMEPATQPPVYSEVLDVRIFDLEE